MSECQIRFEDHRFTVRSIGEDRVLITLLDADRNPTEHVTEAHGDEEQEAMRRLVLAAFPFKPAKGLTPTQRFILAHARDAGGVFFMYRGDRLGTRLGAPDELDRPGFVAYSDPAHWLLSRGLVEAYGNEGNYYRLTEKGLKVIGKRPAPEIKRTKCERLGWGSGIRAAARSFHARQRN